MNIYCCDYFIVLLFFSPSISKLKSLKLSKRTWKRSYQLVFVYIQFSCRGEFEKPIKVCTHLSMRFVHLFET